MMIKFSAMAATAVIAMCVCARVLPETLVLPQCEFYPLREQDRGLLYRYTDQPLFVDPDLSEDEPDPRFETRRHRYWGEWFSQADWNRAEEIGKDFGFDGFGFFPRPHRERYWDAMEKSPIRGFLEVPIAHNYSDDGSDLSKWFGFAVNSKRAYRVNGKSLILSYRFGQSNSPERLKMKLDRMRCEFGDTFVFLCDLSELYNPDEALSRGRLSDKTVAAYKEKVRTYLRVCDGVIIGDAFSCMAFEGNDRVFFSSHYEQLVRLLKETVDEPEFGGKKLLGLAAVLQHENPSVQFWTAGEDGLRTLTESLRIACAADPDVILMPEWDELNENTCLGPTLANGLTVKRVMNYYRSVLGKCRLAPLPGDDVTRPNLIVSYRRLTSPGEHFLITVSNIPDASRTDKLVVSVEVTDPVGVVLAKSATETLDAQEVGHARFVFSSAALAERTRAARVRLHWRGGDGIERVVDEGLSPAEFLPASSFCLKETHQPIRDIAALQYGTSVVRKGGMIEAMLVAAEPIRYAYVSGNGAIQRIFGDPEDPAAAFLEDSENLVFAISGIRPSMLDRKRFFYSVQGVSRAAWLDRRGVREGLTFATDWISDIGDPYYLRIPRQEAAKASLNIDFGEYHKVCVPLDKVLGNGFYSVCGKDGIQFSITLFRRQTRYPSVGKKNEVSFSCETDADRPSMSYHVTVVTASGKTWRSRPLVDERPSVPVAMRVWDGAEKCLRDVVLPECRVPRIRYDFLTDAGDGVPTSDGFRRFATVAGGQYSSVSLWNRNSSGSNDYPLGFRRANLAAGSAAPLSIREPGRPGELVFDGVNDSMAFPWELVPKNAAYRIGLDLFPDSVEGSVALFGSKSLLNVTMEEGELVVSAAGVRNVRTGLRLKAGQWQTVEFTHKGDSFVVTVDGKAYSTPAKLPATFMSSLAFAQPRSGSKDRFFKGRLRNLVFDQTIDETPRCPGAMDETALWQRRIEAAAAAGGGRVVIPAGRHTVGQLDLRSNVELHLEKDAVLSARVGLEHYRILSLPHSEGTWSAVIVANGVTNVAVTGEGEIDGNGGFWPQYDEDESESKRARGLFFNETCGIRLSDFTLRDAACWGVVFKNCDGVVARRVKVDSHANANNDGFDIEAKNVLIEDCDVDTGDDAYCIKSNDPNFTVENVRIRNCIARSTCNCFKIGTATHGVVRNVRFENCRTELPRRYLLDRRHRSPNLMRSWYFRCGYGDPSPVPCGLASSGICIEDVDGGEVGNVTVENVDIRGCRVPIFIRAGSRTGRTWGTPPGNRYDFHDIVIRNVTGEAMDVIASSVTGVEKCPVRRVTLENVNIRCQAAGFERSVEAIRCPVPEVSGKYPSALMFRPSILPAYGLYYDQVEGLEMSNVTLTLPADGEDRRPPICSGAKAFEMREALGKGFVVKKPLPPVLTPETRTVADWEQTRRPELLEMFLSCEYGKAPVERPDGLRFETLGPDKTMMDGAAVRKRVRIACEGVTGPFAFMAMAFLPTKVKGPLPAFLLICNREPKKNIDPERVAKTGFWPAEEIVARGYAAVTFYNGEVAVDDKNICRTSGVFRAWGKSAVGSEDWGALRAWAWGASRVLDWLETVPEVDARRVAVVGHSRGGKTALLAGVTDSRFALACVNDSGCCGAKLNRALLPLSESVEVIDTAFPHWFCPKFATCRGRETEVPFDQHQLLALMAPRLLAVGSASEDSWAGPRGEYASALEASDVWRLYGKVGLNVPVGHDFPQPGEAYQEGFVSYHLRRGTHDLTLEDWKRYMDFADARMK